MNQHPNPEQLAELALFGGLSASGLADFARLAKPRKIAASEVVFSEGDLSQEIYVVAEGHFGVYRSQAGVEHRLAELGPGDFFGEMAFIDMQPRAGTVRAEEDGFLWMWASSAMRATYKSDLKTYTMLVMNVAREISRRLRRADAAIIGYCAGR